MRRAVGFLALGLVAAVAPAMAHHSLAASFDEMRPVALEGLVTRFEWTNPHVYIHLDVSGAGGTATEWEVEFDSKPDLKRAGWSQDSLQTGDIITVRGIMARDGSNRISGDSLTVRGHVLSAAPKERLLAPDKAAQAPKEIPRWQDGHIRLGTAPGERGFWADAQPAGMVDMTAGTIEMNREGLLENIADASRVAPFQPWAKALYQYRQENMFRDDPMASCIPPGGSRQFQDRYGVQLFEQPHLNRVFIMSAGANRNWRIVDMDGRELPAIEDVTPTFYGYSTGHWEGDTLVIESQNYVERFWFSNGGLPHTEQLHLTERISRPDYYTLRYEVTVNDPNAYTRPWTSVTMLSWVPDTDIDEYFCDDNNKETEHLSGKHDAEE